MTDEDLVRRQRNRELVRNLIFVAVGVFLFLGALKLGIEVFW